MPLGKQCERKSNRIRLNHAFVCRFPAGRSLRRDDPNAFNALLGNEVVKIHRLPNRSLLAPLPRLEEKCPEDCQSLWVV